MSNQFVGTPDPRDHYATLATWLHQLLVSTPQPQPADQLAIGEDTSLLTTNYHVAFYPEIPNFAMALLKHEADTMTRYSTLLFHLMSCPTCHRAYLETYDALRTALDEADRPTTTALGMPTSNSLATTPPKLLVLASQLLIGQARAILRQAHREQSDQDAWARALLQQAMQF